MKTSTAVMASHTEKIVKEFCFNKIFLNLEIGVGETAEGALLDKLGCVGAVMFENETVHQNKDLR